MLNEERPKKMCSPNGRVNLICKPRSKPSQPTCLRSSYPKHSVVGGVWSSESRLHTIFLKYNVSSSHGCSLLAFRPERMVSEENLSN